MLNNIRWYFWIRRIPLIISIRSNSKCLIRTIVKNNILQNPDSIMFDNKRLININIQINFLKLYCPFKIIEDEKKWKN